MTAVNSKQHCTDVTDKFLKRIETLLIPIPAEYDQYGNVTKQAGQDLWEARVGISKAFKAMAGVLSSVDSSDELLKKVYIHTYDLLYLYIYILLFFVSISFGWFI